MPAISFTFASLIQIATYPLTGQARRKLNFFSTSQAVGYATPEMMLMNTTQTYVYSPNLASKSFKTAISKSQDLLIDTMTPLFTYGSKAVHNYIIFPTAKTENLGLSSSAIAVSFSNNTTRKFKTQNACSASFVPLSTNVSLSYIASLNKRLVVDNFYSSKFILPAVSLSLEYGAKTAKKLKISDDGFHVTNEFNLASWSYVINYGGENTFYSLNGLFNYFKYSHVDLMQTAYRILIGDKSINMYNASNCCVESHKAGYKRITVDASFLKDVNGFWHSHATLAHIFYEDKLQFYSQEDGKLYTYDFDAIKYSSMNYYNLDSSVIPQNVCLFLDSVYKMPYIMPRSDEANQRITQSDEYWNFVQINNLKLVNNFDAVTDASYVSDIFTPVSQSINNIVFRHNDTFILQGTSGLVRKILYSVNTDLPTSIEPILEYSGSKVIYTDYPIVYYSEYKTTFTDASVYNRLVKFDLSKMDYDVINVDHTKYFMAKDEDLWHLYKKASNEAYYLFRDDSPEKQINLTANLNLGSSDIIEFKVFNKYDIYVIAESVTKVRTIYSLNTQTMTKATINTMGMPILMLKFNSLIGCVLTRIDTKMLFEELQPVLWSTNPADWITPFDMHKGERLLPYELAKNILYARTAPVKTIYNATIVERMSSTNIAMEIQCTAKLVDTASSSFVYPIRIGLCKQTVLAQNQYSVINPKTDSYGATEYSKSLDVTTVFNDDDTFTIEIAPLDIPEDLPKGNKIYVN